jgi:uncharacterized protein YjbI with pentapeptide repeats
MDKYRLCNRPIHHAAGIDGENLCLMHSRDPDKDSNAFQTEFEDILEKADDGVADFSGFVFPEADYSSHTFNPTCNFTEATFTRGADFALTKFAQGATFYKVTFAGDASFFKAKFAGEASFFNAAFMQGAEFLIATFTGEASFLNTAFLQDANFANADFTQKARFTRAKFMGNVSFHGARFAQDADFGTATFTRDARFFWTTFASDAWFVGATFTQAAEFSGARFNRVVNFLDAEFLDAARFRKTHFRGDPELLVNANNSDTRDGMAVGDDGRFPGPIFARTTFGKPDKVEFSQTHLGWALFHKCDVSEFSFSDVTWRRRPGRSGQRMIFDEEIELSVVDPDGTTPSSLAGVTEALRTGQSDPDDRNYGLVAETYRQLKKNYEDSRDYPTAGDFYYGEMEMRRLASPQRVRAFRWWHRNLGLVAWYKYASAYGGSYIRPFVMLLVVISIFTLAFPWAGLDRNEYARPAASVPRRTPDPIATSELSYKCFGRFVGAYSGNWFGTAAFFGNSFMTVLSVAGFQKELKYEPGYPCGRALALLETLLTSTLVALFLLAVRRQFTR